MAEDFKCPAKSGSLYPQAINAGNIIVKPVSTSIAAKILRIVFMFIRLQIIFANFSQPWTLQTLKPCPRPLIASILLQLLNDHGD